MELFGERVEVYLGVVGEDNIGGESEVRRHIMFKYGKKYRT